MQGHVVLHNEAEKCRLRSKKNWVDSRRPLVALLSVMAAGDGYNQCVGGWLKGGRGQTSIEWFDWDLQRLNLHPIPCKTNHSHESQQQNLGLLFAGVTRLQLLFEGQGVA